MRIYILRFLDFYYHKNFIIYYDHKNITIYYYHSLAAQFCLKRDTEEKCNVQNLFLEAREKRCRMSVLLILLSQTFGGLGSGFLTALAQ